MARRKPSGDAPEPETVIVTAEVTPPTPPSPPVEIQPGYAHVELLDEHGRLIGRVGVTVDEARSAKVHVYGHYWRHVSDAPDGVWQFMV